MKKRLEICLMTLVLLLTIAGCKPNYEGWKEVEIANCGTLKIPEEWMKCEYDGKIYFTDRPLDEPDCNIYFFQITDFEQDTTIFSDNIQWGKFLSSENYSNSSGISTDRLLIDGLAQDVHGFSLIGWDYSDDSVSQLFFYTLDTSIDEDTIRKIAKSFVHN